MSVTCFRHPVIGTAVQSSNKFTPTNFRVGYHSFSFRSTFRFTSGKMRPNLAMITLVSSVFCVSLTLVTATPVSMRDDFEAGEPITDEEYSNAASFSKAAELESDSAEFIPWDLQNPGLLEGDVMPTGRKNAILNSRGYWPNATIPYVISANYTSNQRQIIAFGMNEYHNKTCLRFVPRSSEADYIRIIKSGQGCWSFVGRVGGRQDVSLDDGCVSSRSPGVVMHELMHSVGFWHEHMRPDRDAYVKIDLNNVKRQYRSNFKKMSTTQVTTLGLSYDYGSVMHYPKGAFGMNPSVPVIKALIGDPVLGQRAAFSELDLKKLNKLYKCAAK